MRRWFDDASIRWKLTALVSGTTAIALLLAAFLFGTGGIVSFRRSLDQKLEVVAEIVGRNSTAALAFGDKAVAKDVLAALEAEPSIAAAAVFDKAGAPFATYESSRAPTLLPPSSAGLSSAATWSRVRVVRPIVLDREIVGTVFLEATMSEVTTRVGMFAGLTMAIVLASGLVALFVGSRFQQRIAAPILHLADTARQVTSERNFALRARPAARDEVGLLVEDFNRMLAEIERQDRQLRRQQDSLTEEVANRTAALVDSNAQLTASVSRVEQYAEQIAQLTRLGQLLQSCLTPEEVFGVIHDAMPRLFPGDSGAVAIMKASGNMMEAMAAWGHNPPRQRVFEPESCWAFRRGRPHLVTGIQSPLRCAHLTDGDGPSSFCVPMMAQGDHVGILQFNFSEVDVFETRDEGGAVHSTRARLATALAEHAALALANLRLREALRSQSIVDGLTGLYNRRYLENVLERECRRAARSRRPLTVLMIDIDRFKQFNDTWGHEGGDVVLREFAALLRAQFRGDDIACRYGGEEFVVVLSDAEMDVAFRRAEELRTEVRQLVALYRQQPLGSITISVGIAALPEHGVTADELTSTADRALYEAKNAGRDRTVCAQVSPPVLLRLGDPGLA